MMVELLALPFVYAICGGLVAGFTRHMLRFHKNDDRMAGTLASAAFWPVAVFVWLCVFAIMGTTRRASAISKKAAERHRVVVARIKTEMMEDDMGRFGGNTDLAIQFDYLTCPVCHGAGGGGGKSCPRCGGKRVIRVRNGVEEE
jgi:hypothetical protein